MLTHGWNNAGPHTSRCSSRLSGSQSRGKDANSEDDSQQTDATRADEDAFIFLDTSGVNVGLGGIITDFMSGEDVLGGPVQENDLIRNMDARYPSLEHASDVIEPIAEPDQFQLYTDMDGMLVVF